MRVICKDAPQHTLKFDIMGTNSCYAIELSYQLNVL